MIKPHKLNPGDRIATVSLSWGGPGTYPYRYQAGVQQLQEEFGLQVVEMPNTLRDADWLARNPKARAEDWMQAFNDPSIKGIFSTIGGDESIRLLPFIDFDVIREHPKIFLGFSDTTISHLMCYKAGLVSFYGPSIMAGFAENCGMFPYMVQSLRKTLFSSEVIGEAETVRGLDGRGPGLGGAGESADQANTELPPAAGSSCRAAASIADTWSAAASTSSTGRAARSSSRTTGRTRSCFWRHPRSRRRRNSSHGPYAYMPQWVYYRNYRAFSSADRAEKSFQINSKSTTVPSYRL